VIQERKKTVFRKGGQTHYNHVKKNDRTEKY